METLWDWIACIALKYIMHFILWPKTGNTLQTKNGNTLQTKNGNTLQTKNGSRLETKNGNRLETKNGNTLETKNGNTLETKNGNTWWAYKVKKNGNTLHPPFRKRHVIGAKMESPFIHVGAKNRNNKFLVQLFLHNLKIEILFMQLGTSRKHYQFDSINFLTTCRP